MSEPSGEAPLGTSPELRLEISPPRQVISVAVFALLAFFLANLTLGVASARPFSAVFLAALTLLAAYSAFKMWGARGVSIVLAEGELKASNGFVLCRMDEVTSVERGMLAFKPSGGFVLRTNTRQSRSWMPGVWWRLGRSVGIGGVTAASQAKAMADVIAIEVARRA